MCVSVCGRCDLFSAEHHVHPFLTIGLWMVVMVIALAVWGEMSPRHNKGRLSRCPYLTVNPPL